MKPSTPQATKTPHHPILILALCSAVALTAACSEDDDSNNNTATSNGTTAMSNGTSTSNGTTATSNGTSTSNGTTATSNGTSNDTSTSNGTSNGTTATSNGTTATSNGTTSPCLDWEECGGDVEGAWAWEAWCLPDSEDHPFPQACPDALEVTGVVPTGSLTLASDGGFEVTAVYTISRTLQVPASCVGDVFATCSALEDVLNEDGDDPWACEEKEGGCECAAAQELDGDTSGTWSADGNVLTTESDGEEPRKLRFCVEGDTLTLQDIEEDGSTDGAVFMLRRP